MTGLLRAALADAGYRFTGDATGEMVDVAAAAGNTVNFPFRITRQRWAKSDANAKDGNRFLKGWEAINGEATYIDGKATYSGAVDVSDLPKTFTVALNTDQADAVDMGERWVQSPALTHVHDGLVLPSDNDLGSIYVTWRTQALVVGVYREADDASGYTDYQSNLAGGDHRPVPSVGREMTVELLARDSQELPLHATRVVGRRGGEGPPPRARQGPPDLTHHPSLEVRRCSRISPVRFPGRGRSHGGTRGWATRQVGRATAKRTIRGSHG